MTAGGIGRNVLVYSNKKSVWWLSKCVTTAVSVSIVYILIYLSAMIFCYNRQRWNVRYPYRSIQDSVS